MFNNSSTKLNLTNTPTAKRTTVFNIQKRAEICYDNSKLKPLFCKFQACGEVFGLRKGNFPKNLGSKFLFCFLKNGNRRDLFFALAVKCSEA